MNPVYQPSDNPPVLVNPAPAWAILMGYPLLLYGAYAIPWLWAMGDKVFPFGMVTASLCLFLITLWSYQGVYRAVGSNGKAVLVLLGHVVVLLLVMMVAPWVRPIPFLLFCLAGMGGAYLVQRRQTMLRHGTQRWYPLTQVGQIHCAGRYQMGEHRLEIEQLRDGFRLRLSTDERTDEYLFANLPTVLLFLDVVLPARYTRRGDKRKKG